MALALVTGGTSGLGHAFARTYAQRGYDVIVVARDTDRGLRICDRLESYYGVTARFVTADLSKADDVDQVVQIIRDEPVDVVVNCAGFGLHGGLDKPANEPFYISAVDVMCTALMRISGAAAGAMKQRGTGTIINIASASAWIMQGVYSAIKSFVLRYTQALSIELDGTGVTATAVCPGWVRTEFHSRAGISTHYPNIVWVPADQVVAETLRAVQDGKDVVVPSLRWKVAIFLAQRVPTRLIRMISKALVSSRKKDA